MTTTPSFRQLVTQVVMIADRPLTLAEIIARVEMIRPVDSRNPRSTIRNAISNVRSIASQGGRPARYTWWPRHLADNSFRQLLAGSSLKDGTLAMNEDVWTAFQPDFQSRPSHRQTQVTLDLADGPEFQARIEHLGPEYLCWGIPPTPALANWYREQRATPKDDLIVQVVDVDARRYRVALCRRSDRDETAIAARNRALADAAEPVVRAGRPPLPYFDLIPRLIARNAYRDPLPPDPWRKVLRADLRFVVGEYSVDLAAGIVDYLEREQKTLPDIGIVPRPRGDRRKLYSESVERMDSNELQRAWGEYLFDQGMEHLWAGWLQAAEAYYREALRLDPGHADAWVHLGNRCFENGQVVEALDHYERGQAAAEARIIGDPCRYPNPFWLDIDSRPFMRALYGRGICLWRLEQVDEARQVFAQMLELNPNDNQGARFLLHDLEEGLSWEEATAEEEEEI